MGFNKYQFIEELREHLADEFGCPHCAEEKGEKYQEPDPEKVYEYINEYCANYTIYYYKCWVFSFFSQIFNTIICKVIHLLLVLGYTRPFVHQ